MLEVGRDRKTLIFMILLPVVLIPLLLQVTTSIMGDAQREASAKVLVYAASGADGLAELEGPGFRKVEDADAAAAIADGRLDFALEVRPEVDGRREVLLHYDNASQTSKVRTRVEAALGQVSDHIRGERLAALGVGGKAEQAALLKPIVVVPKGVASTREVIGEQVGSTLPFLLIVFCFLGAMYPAIDLAAGEKERGTLQTLLLVPVARWRLVVGKLLVVFVTGVVAAVLSLVGLGVWLGLQSGQLQGALGEVLGAIGVVDLSLIGAMLVPTSLIFASLLLGISIYAKSFKEAQSYIAPLNMVILVPAFMATLPGVELDVVTAWIPVTNVALAVKDLVKGTIETELLVIVFASSMLVGAALLWVSTWWFSRESVVFRR
jgi:sodium transport system permease protein